MARFPFLLAVGLAGIMLAPMPAVAQSSDCTGQFEELMSARSSVIGRIQTIGQRNSKKPSLDNAKAACSEFGNLVKADEKVMAFIESEGAWCGISDEIKGQAQAALENARKERTSTCNVVASAGAAQAAAGACNTEFTRLSNARTSTIGQLTKISNAQKKNPTPQRVVQACSLLNTLVSREDAMLGWLKKNTKKCNIPAKIRSQLAAAAGSSRKSRSEACTVAKQIKAGGAAQASRGNPARPIDPTQGGPGVPTNPGGGVKLPGGAL